MAIIDTRTNQHQGNIRTDARPGGIKIEQPGPRTYVTLAGTGALAVVDRVKRQEIATWSVTGGSLALDQGHHRLFAARGNPPLLVVVDTESGKQIAQLPSVAGIDDQWYDAAHQRISTSGGRGLEEGFAYVFQQEDPSRVL